MYIQSLLQICSSCTGCVVSVADYSWCCFHHLLCSSLLQENTQLTVPILDALSSLNLSSSLLKEVVHTHRHILRLCLVGCECQDHCVVTATFFYLRFVEPLWPLWLLCNWKTYLWWSSSSCTLSQPLMHMRSGLRSVVNFKKNITQ